MQVKKNDAPIKDILKQYVHQQNIDKGYHNAVVNKIWKEKLGPTINKYTRNIKLINKKLIVKIDSAPLRQELDMGKEKIAKLINDEAGELIVEKVEIY